MNNTKYALMKTVIMKRGWQLTKLIAPSMTQLTNAINRHRLQNVRNVVAVTGYQKHSSALVSVTTPSLFVSTLSPKSNPALEMRSKTMGISNPNKLVGLAPL